MTKKRKTVEVAPEVKELFARVLLKLKPPPKLTVSEWADKYRRMSPEASAGTGRWHTDNAPYQRAVMDAIGDPHIRMVVVKTSSQIGKTEIILNTDAQRLQQILTNLLVNACKYTSQGSIVLAYEIAGTSIIISVTDTGCGIDKEKGELIFQRVEKLNSMNPGFGLGLRICRSLTTLLGGKIYLDTQYTGGARFVVELPLHPPV